MDFHRRGSQNCYMTFSSPENSEQLGMGCKEIWRDSVAEISHGQMGTGDDQSALIIRTE